jgi:superfamily II DNA helicase RecQ
MDSGFSSASRMHDGSRKMVDDTPKAPHPIPKMQPRTILIHPFHKKDLVQPDQVATKEAVTSSCVLQNATSKSPNLKLASPGLVHKVFRDRQEPPKANDIDVIINAIPPKDLVQANSSLKTRFDFTQPRRSQLAVMGTLYGDKNAYLISSTGSGKSLALLAGCWAFNGVTVLIVPTKVIAKQFEAIAQKGEIHNICLTGEFKKSVKDEMVNDFEQRVTVGTPGLIVSTPESLLSLGNWSTIMKKLIKNGRLMAICMDEAQIFHTAYYTNFRRTSYMGLIPMIKVAQRHKVHLILASATLTPMQRLDIAAILDIEEETFHHLIVDDPVVPNIQFHLSGNATETTKKSNHTPRGGGQRANNKDEIIFKIVRERKGECGIIFVHSKEQALRLADDIRSMGHSQTFAYFAIDDETAEKCAAAQALFKVNESRAMANYEIEYVKGFVNILDDWISGKVSLLISTDALLIGVDNSKVTYNLPHSMNDIVQAAGRCRRRDKDCHYYLLANASDLERRCRLMRQNKWEEQTDKEWEYQMTKIRQMSMLVNMKVCLSVVFHAYLGWCPPGRDYDDDALPTCSSNRPCSVCANKENNVEYALVNEGHVHVWLNWLRKLALDQATTVGMAADAVVARTKGLNISSWRKELLPGQKMNLDIYGLSYEGLKATAERFIYTLFGHGLLTLEALQEVPSSRVVIKSVMSYHEAKSYMKSLGGGIVMPVSPNRFSLIEKGQKTAIASARVVTPLMPPKTEVDNMSTFFEMTEEKYRKIHERVRKQIWKQPHKYAPETIAMMERINSEMGWTKI